MKSTVSKLTRTALLSAFCLMWGMANADSHSMMGDHKMMDKSDKTMEMKKSDAMMKEEKMKMEMGDKMDQMKMEKEESMMKKGM
ncbi:MAG: hypothetical protein KZQ93_17395 [Candidatus Thiodiazotropha sp. (ex Monitilora ramsayi)]|nr:hypothetical protein [Candidatus Thiodiazotropha sp. (ex Monitilora ramsayi)]